MSERNSEGREAQMDKPNGSSELLRSTISSLLKAADDIKALSAVLEQNRKELSELKAHRIRLEARIASLEQELGSFGEGIVPSGNLN